jgi:hypothetical protein
MAYISVTTNHCNRVLVLKDILNMDIAHFVAEAFTDIKRMDIPLHGLIVREFGVRNFRRYCVDTTGVVYKVTFSESDSPRVLVHQSIPVCIASANADPFELYLQEVDIVKPGVLPARDSHRYIEYSEVQHEGT